jgi:hypothetical protein
LPGPVRLLAGAQLRLDLRHPRTGRFAASRVAVTALAYGFSGLVLAVSLGDARPEPTLFVGGSFGLVLAAFGVAGSYDELMGRPKENRWLMTLPATERQFYAARLAGIAIYFALMAVSVAAPVGAHLALRHGAPAGLGVGALVAGGMLWTAAAALATLWALTLALPARALRTALSATRTVLIAALVLGYQWIGADAAAAEAPWWPAAWLADGLSGRPSVGLAVLLGSVGLLVAAFTAAFPARYFRLLDRLVEGAERDERRARGRLGLSALERHLVRVPAARAAYGFARAAFRDDRLVRGRLWPAALLPLGFAVFGWAFGGLESLFVHGPENALALEATRLHLSLLVVLLFSAQALVQTLQCSDHAEAAWVFDVLPGASPRVLQLGAQQALAYRVLLPLHLALGLLLATRMPAAHAAVHAAFWFAVAMLATRAQALLYRRPPFARRSDRYSPAERFGPIVGAVPGALGVLAVQTLTFTAPWLAAAATLGLLAVSAGLAHLELHARRPAPPRPVPHPGPAVGARPVEVPVPVSEATR